MLHSSLRARSVIQHVRDLRSIFAYLRCANAFGLLGKCFLGSVPFCWCAVSVFSGYQAILFPCFGVLLLDESELPSCSNKGSSRHDQNKTLGSEGRLHEREVPSGFRHVPGWVASGQGLQFWI